jgi:hypothetical protein
MTSLPSDFRRAAREVTASVGEGLTRCARRETGSVTGSDLWRWRTVEALYYEIVFTPTNADGGT